MGAQSRAGASAAVPTWPPANVGEGEERPTPVQMSGQGGTGGRCRKMDGPKAKA